MARHPVKRLRNLVKGTARTVAWAKGQGLDVSAALTIRGRWDSEQLRELGWALGVDVDLPTEPVGGEAEIERTSGTDRWTGGELELTFLVEG